MNYNRKVVVFTLVFTIVLFLYSLFAAVYKPAYLNLANISIISDVIKPQIQNVDSTGNIATVNVSVDTSLSISDTGGLHTPVPPRTLDKYNISKTITAFYTDTALPALPGLMQKLHALKQSKKGKVRIAWFGDSMIEGDLLTKTFRKRLQEYFGGFGVGFIPATSLAAPFRTTANHKWTGNWREENFKSKELTAPLFLSGHLFYSSDGTISLKDLTLRDTTQRLEKSLICGSVNGSATITVNGQQCSIIAPKSFNRIMLDTGFNHNIELGVSNERLPVYGISMEPTDGVVVDNFSFRGITGLELGKLDSGFLQAVQAENNYDLVVLEYGANLMFRPDDMDYSWYQKHIIPVVRKLKQAMPHTEFLIISTADRAFRYGDVWKSATGIDNLVKSQAELAYGSNAAFYNMYQSMGGNGAIVKWADSCTPSLANKDYIHPNLRGAEILGNMFFDAFMRDFGKWHEPDAEPGRFIATDCHSIFDRKTSLEWFVAEDKNYTWAEAQLWANNLNTCSGGWGLPTAQQLLTLYNVNSSAGQGFELNGITYTAKINPMFSGIGHGAWVWTTEEMDGSKTYTINLNQGIKVPTAKNNTGYPVRVFAVRKLNEKRNGS